METLIYLVRHGETNWNKEKRFQGQKDIPLNDFGELQASKLAYKFYNNNYEVDAIYSSDLIRARETAKIIADLYNFEVQVHNGLRERHFGILEGVLLEEIKGKDPQFNLSSFELDETYNIEPLVNFKYRIYTAILEISKNHLNGSILIVSHGAAINSFLEEISDGTLGSGKTKISNTSITTIRYRHVEDLWEIIDVNDASHIEAI